MTYSVYETIAFLSHIMTLQPGDIIWVHADTGWAKTAYGKLFGQWIVGATVMQWKMGAKFEPALMPKIIEKYGVTAFCAGLAASPALFMSAISPASLTRHSAAKAMIIPSCRSVGSSLRTPNIIVKTVISPTTMRPTWERTQEIFSPEEVVMISKVERIALSCSAM